VRLVLVAAASLLIGSACGVPSEPSKQAEEIESVAAEGSLLAHDAAEGGTTGPFVRVHAEALRELLRTLQPEVEVDVLRRLLLDTDRSLTQLADAPGDRARASRVERTLEKVAKVAAEYGA
jgi:hypothetical protein